MTSGHAQRTDHEHESEMAAFLLRYPDFLVRHPEVLAKLHVPHGAGGAVSLIEHQVAVLREQLGIERGRLNHLVARARDFERLADALHQLTVKLILARDLVQAQHALEAVLRDEFKADSVTLKLFPLEPDLRASDPLVSAFIDFIDRDRCLCGPLPSAQGEPLFGKEAPAIHSAALIPIQGHDQTGVLAIGSRESKRFTPDMATDLLERLGAIVSAKLVDLAHRSG